jgi:hypothetical protein
MIDLLLCFPSQNAAALIGQGMGYTVSDGQGGWVTTEATLTLAVCVIGEHNGDGKWWVMVRSLVEMPVPQAILPYVVTPDPDDPLKPNWAWA